MLVSVHGILCYGSFHFFTFTFSKSAEMQCSSALLIVRSYKDMS